MVTGMGAVLPGAHGAPDAWRRIVGGSSTITRLPGLEDPEGRVLFGGQVTDFTHAKSLPGLSERHARKYSKDILMAMCAVEEAAGQASLTGSNGPDPDRLGVIGSSSRGPLGWWSHQFPGGIGQGAMTESPDGILASMAGTPATMSAIRLGARGFVTTLSNACVGGHQAVEMASLLIASGQADAMVVVGHETPLVPQVTQIYTSPSTRVMARPVGEPVAVMRPYDLHRDGFVLGEGAVALVLEREQHAVARGVTRFARITGAVSTNEAAHATRMDVTGEEPARMITALMRKHDVDSADIDYVCGHGTATRYNDVAEARALRRVFGTPATMPPLGSVKPVFGHLLGASGVLNTFATTMMLHEQRLAPTLNCEDVDPECGEDHVAEGPRPTAVGRALSLAFAIGSQSHAMVLEVV